MMNDQQGVSDQQNQHVVNQQNLLCELVFMRGREPYSHHGIYQISQCLMSVHSTVTLYQYQLRGMDFIFIFINKKMNIHTAILTPILVLFMKNR